MYVYIDTKCSSGQRQQREGNLVMDDRRQTLIAASLVTPSGDYVQGVDVSHQAAQLHFKQQEETERARTTAKKMKIPFVDPLSAHIDTRAVTLVNKDTAMRLEALPIRVVDNILLVAMARPEQAEAIKTLELLTSCKVRVAVAPRTSLAVVLKKIYEGPRYQGLTPQKDKSRKGASNLQQHHAVHNRAFSIAIISNKGGVGKTHFAVNLAYALGQKGGRVLLIDADLGNADISNKLAIFPRHHLLDFLQKNQEMRDLIVATAFKFDLICGAYGEFKLANLNYAQKTRFINHFSKISRGYDFVVFDLGAGISRTVLDFALGADQAVVITTPQDLISGYACVKAAFFRFKEIEERLEARMSHYTPRWVFSPMMVINQVSSTEQGFKLYENLVKTTRDNINPNEDRFCIEPKFLGSVHYDKERLRATESKKRPLLLSFPHVKASQCLEHMAGMFCGTEKGFDPRVKFKHSFRRFVAILSKKL